MYVFEPFLGHVPHILCPNYSRIKLTCYTQYSPVILLLLSYHTSEKNVEFGIKTLLHVFIFREKKTFKDKIKTCCYRGPAAGCCLWMQVSF